MPSKMVLSPTRLVAVLLTLAMMLAACGGDDDSAGNTTEAGDDAADAPAEEPAADEPADAPAEEAATDEPAAEEPAAEAPSAGGATAVVTLANGEEFEFGILCALEAQEAAGQEIEFTVVSYDEPYNLDITKWGDSSDFAGGSIGIYDAETYETLWEANDSLGLTDDELTLELNGSTVTGSGVFYAEGDSFAGEGVEGEVVANC